MIDDRIIGTVGVILIVIIAYQAWMNRPAR